MRQCTGTPASPVPSMAAPGAVRVENIKEIIDVLSTKGKDLGPQMHDPPRCLIPGWDEAEQWVVITGHCPPVRCENLVRVSTNLPIISRQLQCQKADVRSRPGETWQEWKRRLSLDRGTRDDSFGACPRCLAGPYKAASLSSGPVAADISSGTVGQANIRSSPDNLVLRCFHQTLLAPPSRGLTSPSRLSRSAASSLCLGHGWVSSRSIRPECSFR